MDKTGKTAITRKSISAPVRWMLNHGPLNGQQRVLDYGCGRGFDAEKLNMDVYDPNWAPDMPKGLYEYIVCTYVLNIIKNKKDRLECMKSIQNKLRINGVAYITVRRDIKENTKTQEVVKFDLETLYKNYNFEIYMLRKDDKIKEL